MSPTLQMDSPIRQRLAQACTELERRLRAGEPGSAADVLRDFPDVLADKDSALEVIYTEFLVREELDQHPQPKDWFGQFPDWVSDLEELFQVHAHVRGAVVGQSTFADPNFSGATGNAGGSASLGDWAGAYDLIAELGRGGMGVVYKARHRALDRIVALKMILGGVHADPRFRTRFEREAAAVARLQHPHIVQVFEVGEHDGTPYFTMEYVDGGTLAQQLSTGPLTPARSAELVEQLGQAVQHAHDRGILHRDLKPGNVLLSGIRSQESGVRGQESGGEKDKTLTPDQPLTPKIADFGLAKLTTEDGSSTQSGAVVGTPAYMSPEQAAGDTKNVGPTADVYALGAILYECLTGRPPFEATSHLEVLNQVREATPVPPSRLRAKLPKDLETVCLKCLEKDPARRYATAGLLAEDLRRFRTDQPILARPPSVAYQLRKFVRRNKVLVGGVAAVFVALTAGLIATSFALARATTQRERAERAEKDLQARLAESYAQAAELALQRGAWQTAIENLDRALAAGHSDQNRLRLEKVRARCALHEVPEAMVDLRELAARSDLGDLQGPILLWQADIALARSVDEAGLAKVRQARELGLSPADDAYAQALLAKTVPEAGDHLRRALEHDRFHHRAHAMLGLLLVAQGEAVEGRERVLLARRIFPDDPNFAILLGLLQARAGNLKAAYAEVDPVQDKLGPRQIAAVRAVLEMAHDLCRIGDVLVGALTGQTKEGALPTILKLNASGQKAVTAIEALRSGPGEGEGTLLLSTPPALSDALQRVSTLCRSPLALANPAKAAENLRQVTAIHPDGLLLVFLGVTNANNDDLAAAEPSLREASIRPSFVPIQRGARFALLFCLWQLYEKEKDRSSTRAVAMKREALEIVHELAKAGDQRSYEPKLTAAVALAMREFDLARWIIAEWQKHADSNDLEPVRKRMLVEFEAGDYDAALKAARKVLEENPKDKNAEFYQEQAIQKLRARAKEYTPRD